MHSCLSDLNWNVPFPFYFSVLLFARNFSLAFFLLAMLKFSLQTCLVVYISIRVLRSLRHAFMFYAFAISHSPYPLPPPATSTPNSTKLMLTITCTCAPLPSAQLTLTLTFTLRSALLSDIADD
jgi:hypothetical protein